MSVIALKKYSNKLNKYITMFIEFLLEALLSLL